MASLKLGALETMLCFELGFLKNILNHISWG